MTLTMTLGLVLTADANSAKAELKSTATEARKVGAEAQALGSKARGAGSAVGALGGAAGKSAADLRNLATAETVVNAEAQRVNQTHRLAAGSVANLTSQFNDIGVMLAAGQNPLQLAIQQGTQISQVIGPMGAAGAAKALGAAFMGMINPVSLITLGSIAAGAAMLQWITGAGEKVPSLDDAVTALADAVDAYEASAKRAASSTVDLRSEFGSAATDAREMLREVAEADRRQAMRAVRTALDALHIDLKINVARPDMGDQAKLLEFFDMSKWYNLDGWDKKSIKAINGVLSAFRDLDEAGTLQEQLAAAQVLEERFKKVAEASDGISVAEDAVLANLREQIIEMQRLQALDEKKGPVFGPERSRLVSKQADGEAETLASELRAAAEMQALINSNGRDSAVVSNARLDAERAVFAAMVMQKDVALATKQELLALWDAANQRRDPFAEQLAAARRYYGETRALGQAAAKAAEEELKAIRSQNDLREAALRYGKNSVQVADLQAAKAHDTYTEYLKTLDVAESVKAVLLAAYERGADLAALDIASGVGVAADEALRLAENLGISLDAAIKLSAQNQLDRMKIEFSPGGQALAKYGSRSQPSSNHAITDGRGFNLVDGKWVDPNARQSGRSGSGSGKTAIDKERKALDELIAQQKLELAILRETDPVQQEMLRHRDALAGATEAERGQVEELITARMREESATERLKWVSEQAGDSLIDALMGGADAGDKLIETLKRATLEALLLGKGPLAGLLGTSGSSFGGLLGGFDLFSGPSTGSFGLPFGLPKAEGGMIYGPGTGTSDEIPIRASNGEFMMNARATARYRHLLEAMNTGSPLPGFATGFATGGMIGAAPSGAAGAAAPVSFVINDYSGQKVEATQGTDASGQPQISMTIGRQAAAAVSQRGNPLRRAMQSEFSLSPATRNRG